MVLVKAYFSRGKIQAILLKNVSLDLQVFPSDNFASHTLT